MNEARRHIRLVVQNGLGEAGMPTRMEPTFSLAFFRRCKDGAVILNANGRVGFMNEPARRFLGLADISDVVQRHWSELWPREAEAKMAVAVERVLSGDAVRLASLPSPSGPLDLLGTPVINKDGVVESIFAVLFPAGTTPRISG